MMLARAAAAFADEAPSILASLGASLTGAGIVAGVVPLPAGLPPWLGIIITVGGPALTIIATRVLAAWAAAKRAEATAELRKAKRMREDNDPTNDADADDAEARAARLQAEAAALDGMRRPNPPGDA